MMTLPPPGEEFYCTVCQVKRSIEIPHISRGDLHKAIEDQKELLALKKKYTSPLCSNTTLTAYVNANLREGVNGGGEQTECHATRKGGENDINNKLQVITTMKSGSKPSTGANGCGQEKQDNGNSSGGDYYQSCDPLSDF